MNETCCRCNSGEFDTLLKVNETASIVKCRKCRLARTLPYPDFNFRSQEKYSRFYLDNEAMFRMFARAMMSVIKEYKSGGAFLDIGCSVGYLLDEARLAGFDSTRGIELNLDSAAITRTKGHVVYTEPMEKVPLEEGMFDVISFNHVLEHILSFKPFLAAVRKTLKADGVIYCGMPNYKGLMQGWLREKWYGWGMPDHVWHFEPATLEAVMGENGFIAKQITQNAMYYPYSRSLRKNTRAAVARIAGGLGLGDQVFGIFEKAPGG